MLQTEEVDDDFFTPIASTSLANIFGNATTQNKEATDNEKLRYTPPKPHSIQKQTTPTKATECLYACALITHEWSNNVYTARGKLGFAIIKIQKSGDHNIVLYDLNKTTLSTTLVSPKLEISIKNNSYICYYDNHQKYWSMYASLDDCNKIIEILTKFGVVIRQSVEESEQTGPPEPKQDTAIIIPSVCNIESDTDSSINKKTKASILNRMANMGQSVFPINTLPVNRTSDSSDTNEIDSLPKVVRHKPVKTVAKRINVDNNLQYENSPDSTHKRSLPKVEQDIDNISSGTPISNRQLIPIANTSFISAPNTTSNNELGLFMSEQRISNSELRINMNRIIDKADKILDKVNSFEHKGTHVQTDILMKLLVEYENKIKTYEELLKHNNSNTREPRESNTENESETLRSTLQNLELKNKEKSMEILSLQNEIKLLKTNQVAEVYSKAEHTNDLLKQISNLENNLAIKNDELISLIKKCDDLSSNTTKSDTDLEHLLKKTMNDIFQIISINFDNNEAYSGDTVKKIIASVIKKMTIKTLSEL